jgi:F-type H+-transporting ATPase subunit b
LEIIPDPVHAFLFTLPFATAAIGVYVILWRPLLRYLDERDQVSALARHEAERFERDAVAQLARIDARLAAARATIADQRIAARGRAGVKEHEILGAARQQADERLAGALDEIERERTTASAALKDSAGDLASQIAGRVLGREVRS